MKKLALIVLAFFMLSSFAIAAEIGQTCTMKKGEEAVQKMNNPFQPLRGVIVPEDQSVEVTGMIDESSLEILKANGFDEEWASANLVEFDYDFGDGEKQRLYILVLPKSLTDCK